MFNPDELHQYEAETTSTIHHVLRAPRRRLTILLLVHYYPQLRVQPDNTRTDGDTGGLTVRKLARQITCIENNVSREHATGDAYHSVYNSLIQSHLPTLDEIGAISYDSSRKTVHPAENLIALAITVSVSSTIGELIFYSALAQPRLRKTSPEPSIDDY